MFTFKKIMVIIIVCLCLTCRISSLDYIFCQKGLIIITSQESLANLKTITIFAIYCDGMFKLPYISIGIDPKIDRAPIMMQFITILPKPTWSSICKVKKKKGGGVVENHLQSIKTEKLKPFFTTSNAAINQKHLFAHQDG